MMSVLAAAIAPPDHLPIREGVSLSFFNWFHLGGPARFFAECNSAEELADVVAWGRRHGLSIRMLGMGANILVRDGGFDGLVIRLVGNLATYTLDREPAVAVCGAGADLMILARECARTGLAGVEVLAGIPASIGGAIRMNAGGKFGEIGPLVRRVCLLHADGAMQWHDARECHFSYRHSELPGERPIIVHAELQLRSDTPAAVLERLRDCAAYKKATQPKLSAESAGCMFKNPTIDGQRVSAGKLIDQAGLKGTAVGAAVVSQEHANFILADPNQGATSAHVLTLIDIIRTRVLAVHGVELELEVDVW